MANIYYLNKNQQPNGDYEVHQINCAQGAEPKNQLSLGYCLNGVEAVNKAKKQYPSISQHINGCYYCCPESNTD